jgi:hypothetical protein
MVMLLSAEKTEEFLFWFLPSFATETTLPAGNTRRVGKAVLHRLIGRNVKLRELFVNFTLLRN